MWKGIDVSDNQGIITWPQVKAAGCDFAVLRSVRRSGKPDQQFAANLAGCRQYHIPVAVYKYTYAQTPSETMEEASRVIALLQQHDLPAGTMVWWDVEDRGTLQLLGRAKLTDLIQTAKTVIEAAGYRFGLYIGQYVYEERWFDFDRFAAVPLWVARYYNGYNEMKFGVLPNQKKKPDVGHALWGWQYTSTGRVPGINGNVDLNISYQDPAGEEEPDTEPGSIWCLSIADVWAEEIARAAAAAYPGCRVHKAVVLDVESVEIWIASIADVWTRVQAEEAQRQFAALGITGIVHNIRTLAQ